MLDIYKKVAAYCHKNPAVIYGDYRDELPEGLIETLLEKGRDAFWEAAWEVEISMQANWYEYDFEHYKQEALLALDIEPDDLTDEQKAEIDNAFSENIEFDFSDFWRVAFKNTEAHIVLVPQNPETGEAFGPVMPSFDFRDNMDAARALKKYFGIRQYRKIANMYEHETLKVCGYVDLQLLAEKGLPEKWRIFPQDNALFHTSWNGSGCLGDVNITKTCDIACDVIYDNNKKYGVDAVYGFTSRWWDSELTPVYDETTEQKTA